MCAIPDLSVRLIDLIAKSRDACIHTIEEGEGHVEILYKVDAMRQVFADVLRLVILALLGVPLDLEEIIKVRLDGDSKTRVDIFGEREAEEK